jgi:hypothetical protein
VAWHCAECTRGRGRRTRREKRRGERGIEAFTCIKQFLWLGGTHQGCDIRHVLYAEPVEVVGLSTCTVCMINFYIQHLASNWSIPALLTAASKVQPDLVQLLGCAACSRARRQAGSPERRCASLPSITPPVTCSATYSNTHFCRASLTPSHHGSRRLSRGFPLDSR